MTLEHTALVVHSPRIGLKVWTQFIATAHPKERCQHRVDSYDLQNMKTLTSYLAGKRDLDDVPRFCRNLPRTPMAKPIMESVTKELRAWPTAGGSPFSKAPYSAKPTT